MELTGIYQDDFFDNTKLDLACKDFVFSLASAGQKNVTVNNGALFTVGKLVIIYDGVGNFETAVVQSKNGNILTMVDNLTNSYGEGAFIGKYLGFIDTSNKKYQRMVSPDLGTGADGAFVSSGNATWSADKNFTSIQIQNGHVITVAGNIQIKCQGDVTIDAGGKLSAKGQGHAGGGGWGYQGASYPGGGSGYRTPNGGGGGGGYGSGTGAGGGAGGGYGSGGADGGYQSPAGSGERGLAGGTYNNPQLSSNFAMEYLFGSGGGGGGAALESPSGYGGNGGGIIRLHCKNLTVNGDIECDGADGQTSPNAQNYNRGGGGGGAGGTVFIQVLNKAVLGANKIHAYGGAGGNGRSVSSNNNAYGGSGGYGRVRLECSGKITGSTYPGYGTGYNNNVGGFTKLGWYFTKELKTYNPAITVNVYIKQEAIIRKNPSVTVNSGQSNITLASVSDFEVGDKIILSENEKIEIKEILSIAGSVLTLKDNIENSYSTTAEVIRVDAFGIISLEPSGHNETLQDMVLQSVRNLGSNIWYLVYSKTIKSVSTDDSGMKLVGCVKLKGKSNDTVDVNVREVNWNYY